MKRWSLAGVFALAVLVLGLAQPAAAQTKVLILSAESDVDIFTGLLGGDSRIDLANSSFRSDNGVTLSELLQYDAVLHYATTTPSSTIGNVLADYVDAGGGVVLATADGFFQSTGEFLGRIHGPGYSPVIGQPTFANPASVGIGPWNTAHPIMDGVTTLHLTDNYGDFGALAPGAELVAAFSDGTPMVAVSASHQVVAIGLLPPSSTAGDGPRLFRNALVFAAGRDTPAVPEPSAVLLFLPALGVVALVHRRRSA